jgi:hypothetical protein
MQNAKSAQPSQDFVPIEQIRDGIVVLRDGSVRAILMASSINLTLKSADEQAAILGQFQNFLNSLDFSFQISIQSRALDIRPYLTLLEGRYNDQQSELMKIQVREYIDFVSRFVSTSSIMNKAFYLVIPYNPVVIVNEKGVGGLQGLLSANKGEQKNISPEVFEEYRSQMEQRISIVVSGLGRTGIRVAQLGTEEVIELYYRLFNIGEMHRQIPSSDMATLQ